MKPAMSRSSVVLPHPLGPSRVVSLPSGTARSMFETAASVPNVFERPTSSTWALRIERRHKGAWRARNAPGNDNRHQSHREQRGGESGSRLKPIVTDKTQDGEGCNLGTRSDEEDRNAEIGDAAHESGCPGCETGWQQESEVNAPEDLEARGAEVGCCFRQVFMNLGEPRPHHLVAEGEIGKGKSKDQDGRGTGERNARPVEQQQVADADKHAGYCRWKHAYKIDNAAGRDCPLVHKIRRHRRQRGCDERRECRIDEAIAEVIGLGKYDRPV